MSTTSLALLIASVPILNFTIFAVSDSPKRLSLTVEFGHHLLHPFAEFVYILGSFFSLCRLGVFRNP